jgi:ATP-dependent Clp protease ATP-binding subunit ClpA
VDAVTKRKYALSKAKTLRYRKNRNRGEIVLVLIQANLTSKKAKTYEELNKELMDILRQRFKPEFLNRIDDIILFHALTKEKIRLIVQLQLEMAKRTAHGQDIELSFTDVALDRLADVSYYLNLALEN